MNAVAGIRSVNPHHINIIRVMGANRLAILRMIIIPTMVPFLVLGLRVSIPEAMTGAVIGEFISASQGLGYPRVRGIERTQHGGFVGGDHCARARRRHRRLSHGLIEQQLPWQPAGSKTIRSGLRPR